MSEPAKPNKFGLENEVQVCIASDSDSPDQLEIEWSKAVSLRRIADALDVAKAQLESRNEYGEGPIEALGGNLSRALRNLR